MTLRNKILVIVAVCFTFIPLAGRAQEIFGFTNAGIIDFIYNRVYNLLYSNPNINTVLIGATATTTNDVSLEVIGGLQVDNATTTGSSNVNGSRCFDGVDCVDSWGQVGALGQSLQATSTTHLGQTFTGDFFINSPVVTPTTSPSSLFVGDDLLVFDNTIVDGQLSVNQGIDIYSPSGGSIFFQTGDGYVEWTGGQRFYVYNSDGSINFENPVGQILFNDFDNNRYGFGTFDTLLNYGSSSGDFASTVSGAHIDANNTLGVIALEGNTQAAFYISDKGEAANKKNYRILNDTQDLIVQRVSDNLATNTTYLTVNDGGNVDFAFDTTVAGNSTTTGSIYSGGEVWGDAQNMTLSRIGNSTFSTVQDLQNVFHSAGWVSGGVISDAGSGNIDVAAGTGLIRDSNSATATMSYFDWTASSTIDMVNKVNYIGVEYNAGSPRVALRTSYDWNFKTDFPLGTVVNLSGILHFDNTPFAVGDHASTMIQRLYGVNGCQRDNRTGGLILGETGTRNTTLSAGTLWCELVEHEIAALDTSGSDTFATWYYNGSAWVEATGVTQYPNDQYNDTSSGLVNLNPNQYVNLWFYLENDGDLEMVYGQATYNTLAQAEDASPPSFVPEKISVQSILIGRIIVQQGDSSATTIDTVFETTFNNTGASDHANLANLDFAVANHTGFAGLAVENNFTAANTFLSVNASSTSNFTDLFVYGNATTTNNLTVDSTTLVVQADTDRVGIGTASPLYGLDVNDVAIIRENNKLLIGGILNDPFNWFLSDQSDTFGFGASSLLAGVSIGGLKVVDGETGTLIATFLGEQTTYGGGANSFGVATSTPGGTFGEKLTVSGNSYFESSTLTNLATIDVRTNNIDGTGYGVRSIINSTSPDTNLTYAGYFESSGTNINDSNYGIYTTASNAAGENYALYSAAGDNYFAGNVGIGDTTPDNILDIVYSGATNYGVTLDFDPTSSGFGYYVDLDYTANSFGPTHIGFYGDIDSNTNATNVYGAQIDVSGTGGSGADAYGGVFNVSSAGSVGIGVVGGYDTDTTSAGAGIYGYSSTAVTTNPTVTGDWAGYFSGDVYTSGDLGVGNTSPDDAIDIAGNEAGELSIHIANSNTSGDSSIIFDTTAGNDFTLGAENANNEFVLSNGTDTTDPIARFQSGGNIIFDDDLYIGHDTGTDDDTLFFDAASEYLRWDDSPGEFILTDDLDVNGLLEFDTTGTTACNGTGYYHVLKSAASNGTAYHLSSYGVTHSWTNFQSEVLTFTCGILTSVVVP